MGFPSTKTTYTITISAKSNIPTYIYNEEKDLSLLELLMDE